MSDDQLTPASEVPKSSVSQQQARLEARELPKYLLAKSLFDCREFDRCASVFLPSNLPKAPFTPTSPQAAKSATKGKGKVSAPSAAKPRSNLQTDSSVSKLSYKSLFLALYAKLMSGEKRKDEDSEMILGPADGGMTVNKQLNSIAAVLDSVLTTLYASERHADGWLEYLYGVVLSKNKNEDLARAWLVRSVHLYPYNWGAWEELKALLGSVEDLQSLTPQLPQNIMTYVFHVHASQELFQSSDSVHAHLDQLQSVFPTSPFLQTERALLLYHSKDFEASAAMFAELLRSHPHRLDSLDTYSNILYVMAQRPLLAFLAHTSTLTDRFHPSTCIIVGNYHSLLSSHEKAVIYFRRALTLDRGCSAAWTLMGHEYVEMKNSHAAIESYRRAVEGNRRDYRAWYGLGQTYEMLEMWGYALWYYQRAAGLRPFDGKMWAAVGQCFARVGKLGNAIRAYKRALVAGSYFEGSGASFGSGQGDNGMAHLAGGVLDPEILFAIASIHDSLNQQEECAAYMELCLAQEERPSSQDELDFGASIGSGGQGAEARGVGVTPTTSKARMWLARYEFSNGEYQRAMELANELCEDGWEVEDAKALVRDVRARVEADAG